MARSPCTPWSASASPPTTARATATAAACCSEADLAALPPDKDLREELDIDSMDFLSFLIALHEKLGLEIPEVDFPQLATVDSATAYLS